MKCFTLKALFWDFITAAYQIESQKKCFGASPPNSPTVWLRAPPPKLFISPTSHTVLLIRSFLPDVLAFHQIPATMIFLFTWTRKVLILVILDISKKIEGKRLKHVTKVSKWNRKINDFYYYYNKYFYY